jgi:hypothetical protein
MSEEQFIKLRGIVKDSGTGVQGHSRSPVENARALLHIRSYQQQGLSYAAAVKTAAAAELSSPSTLRAVSQQFAATGALTPPRTPVDRFKYHHHRGPDWFSPSQKKKGQLADFLRQRDVSSITVDDGRSIPASSFSADARGKAGGPTLVQLKQAVWEHLAEHPEINTTVRSS